jgi:hypothetical protein
MSKAKTIRIRPFALSEHPGRHGASEPRLSIEIDGRILPLAQYVEIVGEIVTSTVSDPSSGPGAIVR